MVMVCLGDVCAMPVHDRNLGLDLPESCKAGILYDMQKGASPGTACLEALGLRNLTVMGIACRPPPQILDDVAAPQSSAARGKLARPGCQPQAHLHLVL